MKSITGIYICSLTLNERGRNCDFYEPIVVPFCYYNCHYINSANLCLNEKAHRAYDESEKE
jgi:hypothetical protein